MRPFTLLRLASVASFLFAAGHTLGGLQSWSPVGDTQVLQGMRAFHFDAGGVGRTYWDFYIGFGLIISVFLFAQSAILWQLATLGRTGATRIRPIIAAFWVAAVANAALTWRFFFMLPLILSVAIAVLLGLAFAVASPSTSRQDDVAEAANPRP